jgi:hypothetical protein
MSVSSLQLKEPKYLTFPTYRIKMSNHYCLRDQNNTKKVEVTKMMQKI